MIKVYDDTTRDTPYVPKNGNVTTKKEGWVLGSFLPYYNFLSIFVSRNILNPNQ